MKKLDVSTIQLENVRGLDAPDFADAYASYAEYEDGTPLTDDELDQLDPVFLHQLIWERL